MGVFSKTTCNFRSKIKRIKAPAKTLIYGAVQVRINVIKLSTLTEKLLISRVNKNEKDNFSNTAASRTAQ